MRFISDDQRTTKLSEEQVSHLFQLIERSYRNDARFRRKQAVFKQSLQGNQLKLKRQQVSQKVDITVNLMYAHLRAKLPALFFQEPTVICSPRRKEDSEKSPIWQKLLNNLIRRNGYKRETKKSTNSAIISAEGWKKIVVSHGSSFDGSTPFGGTGGATGSGPQTEAGTGPAPWSDKLSVSSIWVDPEDVIVDYQAKGRDIDGGSCRFVVVRYLRSLAELRMDPRYKIPSKGDLDYTKFVSTRDGDTDHSRSLGNTRSHSRSDAEEDQVYIYELWVHQLVGSTDSYSDTPDLKLFKQLIVLMDGAKKAIREPEGWEEYVGPDFPGWPIHKMALNEVPSSYPLGEFEAWYQLQQAVNFVMSRALDQIANNGPVDILTKASVENPQKVSEDLKKGKARTVVEVKSGRAGDAFHRIPAVPIQNDLFTILGPLISLTERVSGSSRNRQQQAGIRTATEARNIEVGHQIVEGEHVDIVRDFIKADMHKIAAVVKVIADAGWVKALVGETGPIPWDEGFSSEDVAWMPEIEIEVDSFRNPAESQLAQKWTTILNSSMALMPVLPGLRIDLIYKNWLESQGVPPDEVLGFKDDDRIKQMMEIMHMIQTGEYVEPEPGENHLAELEVIRNFKNTEMFTTLEQPVQQMLSQHEDRHLELHEGLGDVADDFVGQMKSMGLDPLSGLQPQNQVATPQEGAGV